MRLSDRVTGPFIVVLGVLAAYGGSRLPPVPGQQIGPNVFPMVIGIGLAICGALIAMGIGRHYEEEAEADLARITGQKPLVTKSRKAIASFKIRAGLPIGAKVTLRGRRMYEFLDRLINIAMPRIRDFRGVSPRSFDGHGNYSLGVKEQIIFPEIQYDQIDQVRGMDITITTTAGDDRMGRALLEAFNFPFRK
jgi:large subunit ribosomal protein L5